MLAVVLIPRSRVRLKYFTVPAVYLKKACDIFRPPSRGGFVLPGAHPPSTSSTRRVGDERPDSSGSSTSRESIIGQTPWHPDRWGGLPTKILAPISQIKLIPYSPESTTMEGLARMNAQWVDRAYGPHISPAGDSGHGQLREPRYMANRRKGPTTATLVVSAIILSLCSTSSGTLRGLGCARGNVHSADGWGEVLEPILARYERTGVRRYFRADAAFAKPEAYRARSTPMKNHSAWRWCSAPPYQEGEDRPMRGPAPAVLGEVFSLRCRLDSGPAVVHLTSSFRAHGS